MKETVSEQKKDRAEKKTKRGTSPRHDHSKRRHWGMEKLTFDPVATVGVVDLDWTISIWPCRGGIRPNKIR